VRWSFCANKTEIRMRHTALPTIACGISLGTLSCPLVRLGGACPRKRDDDVRLTIHWA
jgi:hypothetical protein